MDTFILIFFGAMVGWLVSKSPYNRLWDIVLGILGALASSSALSALGIPGATGYNIYTFFVALTGAVVVIHFGRSLQRSGKIQLN